MKAYVIITLNLCTMHGANMYICNKTRYLKERGYKVFVFSAEQGEIVIPGLREYKQCQKAFLRFYPGCFSRKRVSGYIGEMRDAIDAERYDEIIVESTNIFSALWGEILAENLHCRHLTIILQERFSFSDGEQKFLRFKLSRHELAGINEPAVGKMLKDENLPFDDSMRVTAYCNNTIDECTDEISPKLNAEADLTIGSIGRLEKKYVLPLAKALGQYCKEYSGKKFNVVFIGGTREEKQPQRIQTAFSDCGNVNLILPGMQYPVPCSFVNRCDLFISAAGAAAATYFAKRPTIFLNPNTGDIIGIPGLTYTHGDYTIYDANYPISDLGSMIDKLLTERDQIRYSDIMEDGTYKEKMNAEFDRQLRFVELCPDNCYYDTRTVLFTEKSYRPFNVLGKIVSPKLLYKGLELARKHIK